MKKGLLMLITLLTLCMVFAGCAQDESAEKPSSSRTETVRLAVGGTNSTSTGYIVSSGMATLIDANVDNVYATVEATSGSVENAKLLGTNEIQLAVAMLDTLWYAYKGVGQFETAYPDINLMIVGNPSVLQIVVPADSDIYTVKDLAGKRVGVGGSASSSATMMVPALLSAFDMTYDDIDEQYIDQSECAAALSDGNIDAAAFYTAYPSSAISELSFGKDIRLISLDEYVVAKLQTEYSFFSLETIPVGTYNNVNEEVHAIGVPTVMAVHANVAEDIVYDIVKMLDEHQDEWTAIHGAAAYYTPERTAEVGDSLFPLHPGTQKYLKEKGLI
ncbi:MAG: TAXI family TRAP transporter solute-binding subunit [Dehalobacterium sp.]